MFNMDEFLAKAEEAGINFRFDPTSKDGQFVITTTMKYGIVHEWRRDNPTGVRGLITNLMENRERVIEHFKTPA